MRCSLLFPLFGAVNSFAVATLSSDISTFSNLNDVSTAFPNLQWLADSFIKRGAPKDFHYTSSTLYLGISSAYNYTQNSTYLSWYKSQVDAVVQSSGAILNWNSNYYSLDDQRFGNNVLEWYSRTKDSRYKIAADTIRKKFNSWPRTPGGGFWHRQPTYPNQMWLDGQYMALPFYAKYTQLFQNGNQTAWNEIARQFELIEEHCKNKTTGLLAHGYDESKVAVWADPVTGAAPHVWSRAVGWYFMALADVLTVFPTTHKSYADLHGYYTSLAAALEKAQDEETGGWWLIMDEELTSDPRNYIESSATAHFTYGFLRGVREGLLDSKYLDVAQRAWKLITDKFIVANADGTANWEGTVEVGSLGSNGSFEYYISVPLASNDFKGAGPVMQAAYEIELLSS